MTVKSILSTIFSGLGKPTFRSVADDYLAVSLANCCAHVQKYTRSRFDLWVYPRSRLSTACWIFRRLPRRSRAACSK